MMTRIEIFKRDADRVSYHEAGHLIALHKLGGIGHIRIEDISRDVNLMERSAFDGRIHVIKPAKDTEFMRIVGLAGAVAELVRTEIREGRDPDEWVDIDLVEERLSDTDKTIAEGWSEDTFQATFDLLVTHWADVEFAASWEIEKLMDLLEVAA